MSFSPKFVSNIDVDDKGKVVKEFLTISNQCPKCRSKQETLLIMYQKDKYRIDEYTYSAMKIECFNCKWKVNGNYKWKPLQTT